MPLSKEASVPHVQWWPEICLLKHKKNTNDTSYTDEKPDPGSWIKFRGEN